MPSYAGTRRAAMVSPRVALAPFEAPVQPSFNILDPGAIWDGENKGINQFLTDMIDPLVATSPAYVTRTALGKDASGTYDVVEYDFNPAGATQTVLLSAGLHGRETVPVYSVYRLIHYLINAPDTDPVLRYLRDTVRIKMIPAMGIWASSQSPKVYTNYNNRNVNRNFPINREFISVGDGIGGRGPSPLSEAESVILMNWLKANESASFYCDWHTDYSYYGQLPTRDVWLFRSDHDIYTKAIIDPVAAQLGARVARLYANITPNVTLEDGLERVSPGKYAAEVLGMPWFTSEYSETRYGGRFGGSLDVQNHLTSLVSLVSAMAKANLRQQITNDNASLEAQPLIGNFHRPVNLFTDKVNTNWSLPALYAAIDDLVAGSGGYASVANIGADASGTYQIRALTLDPGSAAKTVVLIGGKDSALNSAPGIETALLLELARRLVKEPSLNGLSALRASTKFIIIPTMNPYGFNLNAVDLEATVYSYPSLSAAVMRSDFNNSGTVRPAQNLGPSATAAEAVVVRDYLTANVPTSAYVIGLGTNQTDINVVAVRRNASANPAISDLAVSLGGTLLATRTPISPSAVVTLNNASAANGNMATGLYNMGYTKSMTVNLGYSAFRVAAELENVPNNRRTAQAYFAYLVDLLRAAP